MTNEKRYRVGWCVGRRKKERKKGMGGILMKTFEMRKISMDTEREKKEWRWEIYQNKKKQTRWGKSETAKKMWKEDGIVQNQKREGFVKIEGK